MKGSTKTVIIAGTIGTVIILLWMLTRKKENGANIYLDGNNVVHGVPDYLMGSGNTYIGLRKVDRIMQKTYWEYWDQDFNSLNYFWSTFDRASNEGFLNSMVTEGRITQNQADRGIQQMNMIFNSLGIP